MITRAFLDPGYAKSGKGSAVVWTAEDGEIWGADFLRPDGIGAPPPALQLIVVEKPQYDGRTVATCQTTLELAWQGALLAGRLAGVGTQIVELNPRDWKRSVPKPLSHAKLWVVLTEAERVVFGGGATLRAIDRAVERGALNRWAPGRSYYPTGWLTHNLLDAAAMACVYHGRLTL